MFRSVKSVTGTMFAVCVAFCPIAGAQGTSVVSPISIGISGGVSIPTEDLSNGSSDGFSGVNTGYNVTGSLGIGLPVVPFSLRGDVSYNGFDSKNVASAPGGPVALNADVRVVGVTANIVFPISLPVPTPVLRPYLIGGIGDYSVRFSPKTGGSTSNSDFGYNIGAGVTIPLVVFDAFIEARYHHVNQSDRSVAFVPITVGVMF
jgi:opacity protein-like surface antigen